MTTVVELTPDEKKLLDSLRRSEAKIAELNARIKQMGDESRQSGKQTEGAFKGVEDSTNRVLRGLQAQLRHLGPEGQAAANALKGHFAGVGQEGAQSVDEVLEKIRQLDPLAGEAAVAARQKIQLELAEAAKYSEGQFAKPLDRLRDMGPEGRKAAEMLKRHLVDAGKISERSMHDVVEELRKIDPEAAKAADKIQQELTDAAQKSENAFARFGRSAIGQATGIIGSFASLHQLVRQVVDAMKEQIELQNRARGESITLASAQQSTLKNLAACPRPIATFDQRGAASDLPRYRVLRSGKDHRSNRRGGLRRRIRPQQNHRSGHRCCQGRHP